MVLSHKLRSILSRVGTYSVLTVVSVLIIFPLFWMALTSFKSEVQLFSIPPIVLPEPFTLSNYETVLKNGSFVTYFGNSIYIALLTVGISTLLAIPAAYGLARTRFYGSKLVTGLIIFMRMVPGITFCIPYYMLMRSLRLNNTHWALLVMYIPSQLLMSIWLMRNFFLSIPRDIIDSARSDGAGNMTIFRRIVCPLARSTVMLIVLFKPVKRKNWEDEAE